jgi:hypothetical protein
VGTGKYFKSLFGMLSRKVVGNTLLRNVENYQLIRRHIPEDLNLEPRKSLGILKILQ